MKKILAGTMVAGMLLFGFAGQGKAAFSTTTGAPGHVIQVVYDSTYEYATDLGSLSSLEAVTSTTVLAGSQFTGTLDGTALASSTNFAGLTVAYYVQGSSSTTSNITYLGAPVSSGALTASGISRSTVNGNLDNINLTYASNLISTTQTAKYAKANGNGFYYLAENNGTVDGTYNSFVNGGAESSLAALATTGGYVDFNLYGFSNSIATNAGTGTLTDNSSGQALDIRTLVVNGVGETEIVAQSAVPVPPSLLLLAPGLLGLIGIRRKIS